MPYSDMGDAYMNHAGGGYYGTGSDKTDSREVGPEPTHECDFVTGYELGLKHGVERERERWMSRLEKTIKNAVEELKSEKQ